MDRLISCEFNMDTACGVVHFKSSRKFPKNLLN